MSLQDDIAREIDELPWDETWVPIPYATGYEVSDHGNVRSYFRVGRTRNRMSETPRLLKQQLNTGHGEYYAISLRMDDPAHYKMRTVHKIVMESFVGPCPEGLQVAHLNGDSTDNRLVNLQYVTAKENASHKFLHGTNSEGERHGASKLLGWQVEEIKYLASKGIQGVKIAALFDLDKRIVSDIVRGGSWPKTQARKPAAAEAEVARLKGEAK